MRTKRISTASLIGLIIIAQLNLARAADWTRWRGPNADGKSHTFSTNLRDHERAVATYRREIAEQRRLLE